MILVFIFVLIFIGFIFSKVVVSIESFDYSSYIEKPKTKYNVKIVLKIFVMFPFIVIRFKENEVKIWGIKIDSKKIIQNKIIKNNMDKAKRNLKLSRIKYLEPKLEKLYLKINVGTENVFATSILVAWLATSIGIVLQKRIKNYDNNKYKYIVTPSYEDKNKLLINFNAILNIKTLNFIECFKSN